MKLNPDCTREILLAVEEMCDMAHYFNSYEDIQLIKGSFSPEELTYHVRQCHLSGFFYECSFDTSGGFSIVDLSPKGHEFLANIRSDTIWNSVKSVSTSIGVKSLNALSQIATAVVSEIIKSHLGIPL